MEIYKIDTEKLFFILGFLASREGFNGECKMDECAPGSLFYNYPDEQVDDILNINSDEKISKFFKEAEEFHEKLIDDRIKENRKICPVCKRGKLFHLEPKFIEGGHGWSAVSLYGDLKCDGCEAVFSRVSRYGEEIKDKKTGKIYEYIKTGDGWE